MGILAEVIQIVIPPVLGGAATVVADRIAKAAVDWLLRMRRRKLGSGGIVEVKILGSRGEVLARVEVPSEHVGTLAQE